MIANLNTDTSLEALRTILQRTALIEVMTRAAGHKVCSGKLLASLVFLASVLGYFRNELMLTK